MNRSTMPRLVSIQVSLPMVHGEPGSPDPLSTPWRTGFYKLPVAGPVWLGTTNLSGDGQANLKVHGGPDKAVLAYAASHYPLWRAELQKPDLSYGAFGENFTVTLADETSVCLGDVYAIGEARLQVTQPRQPCANITRRWKLPGLTERVAATGRHGWYLRVLTEAEIAADEPMTLIERPHPEWSVSRAFAAMRHRKTDPAEAAALVHEVPSLSASWRQTLSHL